MVVERDATVLRIPKKQIMMCLMDNFSGLLFLPCNNDNFASIQELRVEHIQRQVSFYEPKNYILLASIIGTN